MSDGAQQSAALHPEQLRDRSERRVRMRSQPRLAVLPHLARARIGAVAR